MRRNETAVFSGAAGRRTSLTGCNSAKEAKHSRTEKVQNLTWAFTQTPARVEKQVKQAAKKREKQNNPSQSQQRRAALTIKNWDQYSIFKFWHSEELGEVAHVETNKRHTIANEILTRELHLFLDWSCLVSV